MLDLWTSLFIGSSVDFGHYIGLLDTISVFWTYGLHVGSWIPYNSPDCLLSVTYIRRITFQVYNILVQEADSESSVLADLVVEKDEGTEDSVLSSSVAWQDDVEAVDLCMEGLAEIYVEALRDALVDTTEDLAVCCLSALFSVYSSALCCAVYPNI